VQQQQPDMNNIKENNNTIPYINNNFNDDLSTNNQKINDNENKLNNNYSNNNNNYNNLNNPINMNNQPVNSIQNNNYSINNFFSEPFSQNYSSFDNHRYYNSLPFYSSDNGPIKHADSFTDIQAIFNPNPNIYKYIKKPSNASIISTNGNKTENDIENPFMLNGQNASDQNILF
jgi:hypothetical protein